MDYTSAERSMIWLCGLEGLEYRERAALLSAARDPENLTSNWQKFVSAVIKDPSKRVYMSGRNIDLEIDSVMEGLERREIFAVTPMSDDYPESFSVMSDPPLVLFGSGNRALLKKRKFCIVGSRITPPWAATQGKLISEALTERFAVVTGLAEGGDSAAIAGALESGNLISVLPNGLNRCYPAAHASLKEQIRRKGLLLSEFPPDTVTQKNSFHARNRLLAGLSEGVLVVSAGRRSGTLITANRALEYGRDVFAFPHNLGAAQGEGCNALIQKGAYLCTSAQDIFDCYGMQPPAKREVELTQAEERVLHVLRESGALHTALIASQLGIQIFEAASVLSSLEMKNLVVKSGGNCYAAL